MTNKTVYIAAKNCGSVRNNILGIYTSKEEALKAIELPNRWEHPLYDAQPIASVYQEEVSEKYEIPKDIRECVLCVDIAYKFDKDFNIEKISNVKPTLFVDRCTAYSQFKQNEVKFTYRESRSGNMVLDCICRLGINEYLTDEEIIEEAEKTILNEFICRLGYLDEMIEYVSIKLDPKYNFINHTNEFFDIKINNKMYGYTKEAENLVSSMLHEYLSALILDFKDNIENFNEINKIEAVGTNKTKIRKKIVDYLSTFSWYKDSSSLEIGFKKFIVDGYIAF